MALWLWTDRLLICRRGDSGVSYPTKVASVLHQKVTLLQLCEYCLRLMFECDEELIA